MWNVRELCNHIWHSSEISNKMIVFDIRVDKSLYWLDTVLQKLQLHSFRRKFVSEHGSQSSTRFRWIKLEYSWSFSSSCLCLLRFSIIFESRKCIFWGVRLFRITSHWRTEAWDTNTSTSSRRSWWMYEEDMMPENVKYWKRSAHTRKSWQR